MQELLELAKEKGFEPKTLTTGWTFRSFFGGKKILINETCILLLMHEIQAWLMGEFKIIVWVQPFVHKRKLPDNSFSFFAYRNDIWIGDEVNFKDFKEALVKGLIFGLNNIDGIK